MSESHSLIPFAEIKQMAVAVATSQLFGMKTPEQALTLMLLAQAEGMHPITAARDYDIIQGRPAKKAEAMHRDFLKGGGKMEWKQLDDTAAEATFSHPVGGEVSIRWDMERAKMAGLAGKDNWRKSPRQMLRSRVISEGIRTVFPLATGGVYVPEEVRDFDPPPEKPPTVNVEQPKGPDQADALAFAAKTDGPELDPASNYAEMMNPAKPPEPEKPKEKITIGKPTIASGAAAAKEWAMFWAQAKGAGWEADEVHDYVEHSYGVKSLKDLTPTQLDLVKQHLQAFPPPRGKE